MDQAQVVRSRVVLNAAAATEIYQYKIAIITPNSFKACMQKAEIKMKGHSTHLARKYGVSSKTIRDIWNRKSWIGATAHLWKAGEDLETTQMTFYVSQIVTISDLRNICFPLFQ